MIRRFYVMPLRFGVTELQLRALLDALETSDRFIPGLLASSAGVDLGSRTVVWENNFVDEESYAGPYMVHPYHSGTLDDFLMADSPHCLTRDIYTTRYAMSGHEAGLDCGIRRLLLMKVPEGGGAAKIEKLADRAEGAAESVFRPDNVGWVSVKGRPWTHIWEQGFADREALEQHLRTPVGIGTSSLESFDRLGIKLEALRILTYPFALKPAQQPTEPPYETGPVFYTLMAGVATQDVARYVAMLEALYDPYVVDAGGSLVQRWRTIENGYAVPEVHSTWKLASMSAYADVRFKTVTDERWSRFVTEAMPLVRGGSRRFYRAC